MDAVSPDLIARLSLCVGALAVSGCGPEQQSWIKPGATASYLQRDLADCEREATGPGPFYFQALNQDYVTARDQLRRKKESCMIGRGWRPTDQGQADGNR